MDTKEMRYPAKRADRIWSDNRVLITRDMGFFFEAKVTGTKRRFIEIVLYTLRLRQNT